MKIRPILMKTAMVQAILAGNKTQTRRIIKPQPDPSVTKVLYDSADKDFFGVTEDQMVKGVFKCPYGQFGDVLWVRETWNEWVGSESGHKYAYKATDPEFPFNGWKPSLFMPREACRLWLEIADIRVERLQEISEQDCIAEGVKAGCWLATNWKYPVLISDSIAKSNYASLWESINGKGSWESNPWVWVAGFKRIEKPASA